MEKVDAYQPIDLHNPEDKTVSIRYACMDDYNRSLKSPSLSRAHLNGDTCVRSELDQTLPIETCSLRPPIIDITEDWMRSEEVCAGRLGITLLMRRLCLRHLGHFSFTFLFR